MKAMMSEPYVVVCVSESASGQAALRVAAHEAASRHCPLLVLRVWREVGWLFSMTCEDAAHTPAWYRAEQRLMADAVATVRTCAPDVEVFQKCVGGDLHSIVADETRQALVVVVGSSRHAPYSGLGPWLRHHVTCPVVIVGAEDRALVRVPVRQ